LIPFFTSPQSRIISTSDVQSMLQDMVVCYELQNLWQRMQVFWVVFAKRLDINGLRVKSYKS
jgi:hypothetical protein